MLLVVTTLGLRLLFYVLLLVGFSDFVLEFAALLLCACFVLLAFL